MCYILCYSLFFFQPFTSATWFFIMLCHMSKKFAFTFKSYSTLMILTLLVLDGKLNTQISMCILVVMLNFGSCSVSWVHMAVIKYCFKTFAWFCHWYHVYVYLSIAQAHLSMCEYTMSEWDVIVIYTCLTVTGLRHSAYVPASSQMTSGMVRPADFRASLGSIRPTTADINGKISEQKRWVEEFSKSVPYRPSPNTSY